MPTRRVPKRYLITWRKKTGHDFRWHERLTSRKPDYFADLGGARGDSCLSFIRVEDLKTGEIQTNFGLREEVWFAMHDWPKRKAAIAALARFQVRGAHAARVSDPAARRIARRDERLDNLRQKEKNWGRKLKLAATKLKKLRAAIKRYERTSDGLQTTDH